MLRNRKIWRKDTNESLYFTRNQTLKLKEKINNKIFVEFAMRYGNPSINSELSSLRKKDAKI